MKHTKSAPSGKPTKPYRDFPRPKTGVVRRCPLWPESVEAIRDVLAKRREPKGEAHADLLFISKRGLSFAAGYSHRRVTGEMAKVLLRAGVRRPGLSFYALRHTFQTVGDGARDPVAVQAIMGHSPRSNDMGAVLGRAFLRRLQHAFDHHARP